MSGAFPDALRTHGRPIVVSPGAQARVSVRVQLLEAWATVLVDTPADEPVLAVKVAALSALDPSAAFHGDYVVKHRGVEIRDESVGLADAGVPAHATLSLGLRRRRPVR